MGILEAIVLGVVQGLAEFLPVSSSGHLQIAKEVLGVKIADNLTFDVMLHVATVLATIVVLWREVEGLFKGAWGGVTKRQHNDQTAYLLKIVLSMVPVAAVGLLFRRQLNAMLASETILLVVGTMLLVTAGLLIFAGRASRLQERGHSACAANRRAGPENSATAPIRPHSRNRAAWAISWRDAIVMGLAQAAAAMPGLSRSGTTIATGLLLGGGRAAVAQFSFLMIIPPILGEALLDLIRGAEFVRPTGGLFGLSLSGADVFPYIAGFAAAFGVGCVACRFMIEMVKRSRLVWFAVYCAVVGTATIIYYFV
jgi:undecaprenyl-diphosphatase